MHNTSVSEARRMMKKSKRDLLPSMSKIDAIKCAMLSASMKMDIGLPEAEFSDEMALFEGNFDLIIFTVFMTAF